MLRITQKSKASLSHRIASHVNRINEVLLYEANGGDIFTPKWGVINDAVFVCLFGSLLKNQSQT